MVRRIDPAFIAPNDHKIIAVKTGIRFNGRGVPTELAAFENCFRRVLVFTRRPDDVFASNGPSVCFNHKFILHVLKVDDVGLVPNGKFKLICEELQMICKVLPGWVLDSHVVGWGDADGD